MRIGIPAAIVLTALLLSAQAGALLAAPPATVDLTKAVVVSSDSANSVELQAAMMLRWEVQRRIGMRDWGLAPGGQPAMALPAEDVPAIFVGSLGRMPPLPAGLEYDPAMKDGQPAAEGYILIVDTTVRPAPTVVCIGNDHHGALYAVGRLLRALEWSDSAVKAPADLHAVSAPAYPIRGMQLGYREINDTYDSWDVGQFAQYFRDLIVFGDNAVELIPALRPGAKGPADPSPVMPATTWDTTVALSALLKAYDMQVWFWLPLADGGAENPKAVEQTLRDRDALFAACSRIDNIFVPGGDPGNTPPPILMPYLKDLAAVLRKHHPNAGLWVSTQGFEPENLSYFYEYLQKNQPDWLTGVVYGPWVKDTLQHTREAVPAKYPIRRYPDITHTVANQYPFPSWDEPWFRAYERQPIQPRPTQMAHTCNVLAEYAAGAICYSDGTGDDVNKMVWNAMLWDPKADLREVLRDFGRYFVGPEYADGVADGLLMLEQNWVGPALTNPQVVKTLAHWQAMEKRATPKAMGSWRFQQGLIRAYGDAYVQAHLKQETALLDQACAELRKAHQVGTEAALAKAEAILKQENPNTVAPEFQKRIGELADMLFHSIGMQLSVEKYGANSVDRGALLDTLYRPLTDDAWLALQIPEIRKLSGREAQLGAIDRIVNWTDPGPGGFYDDLGNGANGREPHLVLGPGWEKDPGFVVSAQDEHGGPDFPKVARMSWINQAQTLYWTPLRMRYTGLDPKGTYVFRATYTGRFNPVLQLYFDDQKIGEPLKAERAKPAVHEFAVPKSAIADGVLEVKWETLEGRGAQIAEAWLVKKK